jgi:hypothetical protein
VHMQNSDHVKHSLILSSMCKTEISYLLKIAVYWHVTLYSSIKRHQHTGVTCCLHLQCKVSIHTLVFIKVKGKVVPVLK